MKPGNFEEKLIWYSLIGTYGLYFAGGLYVWWSGVAWVLAGRLFWKLYRQSSTTPAAERIAVPASLWIWVVGMVAMELALVMGHGDFDLGFAKTITSTINWGREWALFAVFPLVGCLPIRPQLLYRAVCVVCLQSLLLIPVFYAGYLANLPDSLYVSPLRYVGGNNAAMYEVFLYQPDPENNQIRLQLFAPWAPALGLVANVYLLLALNETSNRWRWIGIVGALLMAAVSFSRLAIVALIGVAVVAWLLRNLSKPLVPVTAGLIAAVAGVFATGISQAGEAVWENFNGARAASSRVRSTLGRIALERWQNDAPVWGHGVIEPKGPKIVEFMPIGTHHTWFSLLYTKGIVGFGALAAVFAWSIVVLAHKSIHSPLARTGLSLVLTLCFYTFGENIDSLCYLYAPGLMIIGMAFKEKTAASQMT